jgi:threonine dehydratase
VILMPGDAPVGKVGATEGHGAEVIRFDRYDEDREALLAELVAERELVPIHPYDDERVMAGQGTVALELIDDVGPLDLLLVCVGGGGLISGCATAAKGLLDGVRVVGVEPEAGDDVRQSLAAARADPGAAHDRRRPAAPEPESSRSIRERVDAVELASDERS